MIAALKRLCGFAPRPAPAPARYAAPIQDDGSPHPWRYRGVDVVPCRQPDGRYGATLWRQDAGAGSRAIHGTIGCRDLAELAERCRRHLDGLGELPPLTAAPGLRFNG